jgi:hypothetical protein
LVSSVILAPVRDIGCVSERQSRHVLQGKTKKVRDFHVRRLRIRMFSQSLVCVHRTDLGSCILNFFFFTDSRGSTLYIFLYVSFV